MSSKVMATLVLAAVMVPGITADEPTTVRFAKIFSDNMVLQQNKPITIWGWAEPGTKVAVTLTQDSKLGANSEDEWVRFTKSSPKSPPVDDSYSVTVQYVETNPPKVPTSTIQAQADKDGRWTAQFKPAKASFQPTWIIAKSGAAISVVKNVLIGEIWVCAGQSNMAWTNFNRKDREAASADFPGLRYVAWHDSDYKPLDDVRSNIRWQVCSPESAKNFSAVPYLYGMYLHRYLKVPVGIINVARGGTLGQTWCLREELDGIDNKIIKTVLNDYDASTAAWDDPKQLSQIMSDWQTAVKLAEAEYTKKAAEAKAEGKKMPRKRLPKKPDDPRRGWSPPAGLFNATIMPIRHLGIRGVLYYQGENNNFMRWTRYESTFPKVPISFRKAFGDENLPFGCISQPGWGQFGLDPEVATVAEGYAIVRDIQRRALADDPNAGMIATYPTGNSYIHPEEKQPIAEYASLWALAKVYKKPVVHTGNTYREMKTKGNKLYVFFDIDPIVFDRWKHIENNAAWQVLPVPREGNAEFQGFIIAGKDRRWYPAKGKHVKLDGKWCIELTSDLVDEPVAARYGWANWPTGNMVGRNRLPVPTFRTDDWPIPEGVNYSAEAQQKSRDVLTQLRQKGEQQALDRKLRQSQLDVPRLETELYKGDAKKQMESKVSRMEAILKEFQEDRWLADQIRRNNPEFAEQIEALRKQVQALKAKTAPVTSGK